MKKTLLRKYARLIVRMGVNVQKKQGVVINCAVDQHEFAKLVVDEAYKAGAKWVRVDWLCQDVDKLRFRNESVTTMSKVCDWEKAKAQLTVDEGPAMIHIVSNDPDGLKGLNVEKMQKINVARMKVLKPFRDAWDGKNQWTIVAVPSVNWSKKIFPGERGSKAVEMHWEAIFNAVRISEDNDPVKEWEAHNANLQEKSKILSDYNFEYVHMKNSKGTDFKCWLIDNCVWCGGGETVENGTFFNPNMPTEEVFVSPLKGKAEGTVVSAKPLSTNGQLIDEFSITFENGKAVKWSAKEGEELLGKLINMDEGSSMLGEVALIPYDSAISKSNLLFYNTLFDENASCHLAIGKGFGSSVKGFEEMSREELSEKGINDSILHLDFMIGTKDMDIDGYTRDGKKVAIFRNGNWAI